MRFQRVIQALYKEPLLISEAGFQSINAVVRNKLAGQPMTVADGDFVVGKTDLWGTELKPILEVENGRAKINVHGPLIRHAELIDKSCGLCSYDDLQAALKQAASTSGINGILMDFRTPGGQHCGAQETAELIARIEQSGIPMYAFMDDDCCSAGYFLAVGCTGMFGTKTATIGCVGSMIAAFDESKFYSDLGVEVIVIGSGKYKGMGTPGTSFTPEQLAFLTERVGMAAEGFKAHVRQYRPGIREEDMEGQFFWGEDALRLGFIDGIVADIEEVEEMLSPA